MQTASLSFSVLFGSAENPATKNNRPFASDAAAKAARDTMADFYRVMGWTVRKSSLRTQVRPCWDWQVPCGQSCTVYVFDATHLDLAA